MLHWWIFITQANLKVLLIQTFSTLLLNMTGQKYPHPMRQSGSLDEFERFDLTPILGTEFRHVDVADWLTRSDSDRLLRDLAILSKTPLC